MKTLVVYFSRTGHTKELANLIAKFTNADAEPIQEAKKRKMGPIAYLSSGFAAARRKKSGILESKRAPKDYDLIFIGTPIWAGNMAPAVRAYLSESSISGKKVGLFCSCGGSEGKAFKEMRELLPGCAIAGELAVREMDLATAESAVKEWLKSIKA